MTEPVESKTEPAKSKTEPVESRTEQTTEPIESKTEQTIGTEADVVRLDGFGYLQKHKASTVATTPGPQLPTTRNSTKSCKEICVSMRVGCGDA